MPTCVYHATAAGPGFLSVANSSVDRRLEIKVFLAGPFCIPALYFHVVLFTWATCFSRFIRVFEIEWLWDITLTTLVDAPIGVDARLLIANSTLLC
ncbi:hypothetical protein ANO14919_075050 [Xylariales sp. No.14919]|nr:hypothetical protein ANO14919_075050 [Xylariales sp. No.14919]